MPKPFALPNVNHLGESQAPEVTGNPRIRLISIVDSATAWFRNHLSRVTSSGKYIPEIDGLRFMAITWVVLLHLQGFVESRTGLTFTDSFTWLVQQGQLGVLLFFVVSGFILGLPFAEGSIAGPHTVSLRRYFLRRLTRLEPPYIFNVVIATALFTAAYLSGLLPHLHGLSVQEISKHALASLFYSHNLVFGELNPINWVLWTLEVEIQFYISLPLIAICFQIHPAALRRAIWLALVVGCSVVATMCFQNSWRFHHSLLGNLQYFLAGLLLADFYTMRESGSTRRSVNWDLIAFPAWLSLPVLFAVPLGRVALPLAIMLAYAGVFWGMWLRRFFRNVWVATIGGMCYSIYLYHYLVILTFGPVTTRLPRLQIVWLDYAVQLVVLSTAVLVVSAIAFVVLERPFMIPDWPRRLTAWYRQRPSTLLAETMGLKDVDLKS